jgi:hypothetical protein
LCVFEENKCQKNLKEFKFRKNRGTVVMFLIYFRQKNSRKIGVFDSKQSYIMQKLNHNNVF